MKMKPKRHLKLIKQQLISAYCLAHRRRLHAPDKLAEAMAHEVEIEILCIANMSFLFEEIPITAYYDESAFDNFNDCNKE